MNKRDEELERCNGCDKLVHLTPVYKIKEISEGPPDYCRRCISTPIEMPRARVLGPWVKRVWAWLCKFSKDCSKFLR